MHSGFGCPCGSRGQVVTMSRPGKESGCWILGFRTGCSKMDSALTKRAWTGGYRVDVTNWRTQPILDWPPPSSPHPEAETPRWVPLEMDCSGRHKTGSCDTWEPGLARPSSLSPDLGFLICKVIMEDQASSPCQARARICSMSFGHQTNPGSNPSSTTPCNCMTLGMSGCLSGPQSPPP